MLKNCRLIRIRLDAWLSCGSGYDAFSWGGLRLAANSRWLSLSGRFCQVFIDVERTDMPTGRRLPHHADAAVGEVGDTRTHPALAGRCQKCIDKAAMRDDNHRLSRMSDQNALYSLHRSLLQMGKRFHTRHAGFILSAIGKLLIRLGDSEAFHSPKSAFHQLGARLNLGVRCFGDGLSGYQRPPQGTRIDAGRLHYSGNGCSGFCHLRHAEGAERHVDLSLQPPVGIPEGGAVPHQNRTAGILLTCFLPFGKSSGQQVRLPS